MFKSPVLFPQILSWNTLSLSGQQLSSWLDTAGIISSTETLKYVMNQHLSSLPSEGKSPPEIWYFFYATGAETP